MSGWRDAATIACADVVAVPSAQRARTVGTRLPAVRDRLLLVPIGANIEPPASYARAASPRRTIVSFGVVSPRRRVEIAIRAVAALVAGGEDIALEVIGRSPDPGYAASLRELAASCGIAERVRLRGELDHAALSAALAGAVAAVHAVADGSIPSSGSLLALLAHGVPTIALRTPADDDVFNGAMEFVDDEAGLAGALRALLREPAAAGKLTAAATDCYRVNFAWTTAAGRLQTALAL